MSGTTFCFLARRIKKPNQLKDGRHCSRHEALWGIKIALYQIKIVFFSAKFSFVTRIMFEKLKFKVFKHFFALSQRYKLEISLNTREIKYTELNNS